MWLDWAAEDEFVGVTAEGQSAPGQMNNSRIRRGATVDLISDNVVRHVDDMRAGTDVSDLRTAMARGLLVVGDGALYPGLTAAVSGALRARVHLAAAPRTAALNGAGLAAMSLLRHPAGR